VNVRMHVIGAYFYERPVPVGILYL